MSEEKNYTAPLLLILLSLIWGTSFILIKKGLIAFAPQEVGALRVASASIFLLPMALANLKYLNPAHYWKLFLSGILGIFIPAFLFAFAQTQLSSSVTGIFNSLTPLITLLIGTLFFNQLFRKESLLGIVIGLVGSILLILANSGGSIRGINVYASLILLACICYATNLNFIKYKINDLKSLTITSVSLLLIGPLAIGYLLIGTHFTQRFQEPYGWQSFGFIVLLGLMSTCVATILFNRLVKITSPLYTSSVTYIIPIIAVMWGVLDGESLYVGHYIGMAAIIGGVYLANRKK